MKPLILFSKPILILWMALSFGACSKNESGTDNPGGGEDISLTTPAPYRGNVPKSPEPMPIPQELDVYAPFAGVWKGVNSKKTIVLLADGRVAFKEDGQVSDVGMYTPGDYTNMFDFTWMLEDAENAGIFGSGDEISISSFDYTRIGDAAGAPSAYNQIYNEVQEYAARNNVKYRIGSIAINAADEHDPKPGNVIKGATVFTGGTHYQASFTPTAWYKMPNGTIEGFDGYSRADVWLMPNGRFCYQMWLWDGVNPPNRTESYRTYKAWGKYTIIKGSNALTGDIINCYYDNGGSAAYKTVGGQSSFLVQKSMYHYK